MWQAPTSDVSVCCDEHQCMPGQSGRHSCVDRHIGKRQEKKPLLISNRKGISYSTMKKFYKKSNFIKVLVII